MKMFGRILFAGFRSLSIRNAISESSKPQFVSSFWKAQVCAQERSLATANATVSKLKLHSRTPYIIFVTEKMPDLRTANPGIRVPDLGRKLGQMWRLLSEEEKEVYRVKYREHRVVFEAEKKAKLDKLSKAEKERMVIEAKELRRRRKLRRRKRLLKYLEKPKPVDVNPYILFVKARAIERGDAPFQQYVRGLSGFWKKMPEEDKQPYVDQARANSVKYRVKLAEWEKRMLAQGRNDLVRRSALRRPRRARKVKASSRKPAVKVVKKKHAAAKPKAARKQSDSTQTDSPAKRPGKRNEE